MENFKRSLVTTLVGRLHERPDKLIAIFGPRQSGKTTITRQALQIVKRPSVHLQVDLVATNEIGTPSGHESTIHVPRQPDWQWLAQTWQRASDKAVNHPDGFILALDGIQKIPGWSTIVKGLWDADRAAGRQLHVIILGSTPMSIQSSLNESLTGRFELLRVPHWSFDEMAKAFGVDLDEYLYYGGYPGGAQYIHEEDQWRGYVWHTLINLSIEQDLLAMTRVEKPATLKRLFHLGSSCSGQVLPFNRMLDQLPDARNITTLLRYLDLLSRTGLLTGFAKYAPSKRWIRQSSLKLNVCNTALLTMNSGYTFSQARNDRTYWDRLVESAIGAHIFNSFRTNIKAYYWQDRVGGYGSDADFVLQQGPHAIGIKVKSGPQNRHVRRHDTFTQEFNPSRMLLVGDGGIPIGGFLSTPIERWFDTL